MISKSTWADRHPSQQVYNVVKTAEAEHTSVSALILGLARVL